MSATFDRLHPGHAALCPGCQHYDASMDRQGHPEPCKAIAWRDARRHVPTIAASGAPTCDDYEPKEGSGQ